MISQMNVVQNAARLAMDHRAAAPGRRRAVPAQPSRLVAMAKLTTAIVVALVAAYILL